jgi:putative PIN family toxin of toxin-antitoxin system
MIRAVVDTNITVSGLLFGGLPLKVVHAAVARRFTWVTSPVLMDEIERVVRSEKFGLTQQEIKILTAPVFGVAEIVVPIKTINAIPRCPADNRVLECAVEGKCSVIVSGDRRDLLSLKHFHHVEIVTARQFLERI